MKNLFAFLLVVTSSASALPTVPNACAMAGAPLAARVLKAVHDCCHPGSCECEISAPARETSADKPSVPDTRPADAQAVLVSVSSAAGHAPASLGFSQAPIHSPPLYQLFSVYRL